MNRFYYKDLLFNPTFTHKNKEPIVAHSGRRSHERTPCLWLIDKPRKVRNHECRVKRIQLYSLKTTTSHPWSIRWLISSFFSLEMTYKIELRMSPQDSMISLISSSVKNALKEKQSIEWDSAFSLIISCNNMIFISGAI